MWKLKPEARSTPEIFEKNLQTLKENFRILEANIPQIHNLQVLASFKHGNNFFDLIVTMDFDSRGDLESFQKSPAHHEPQSMAFCDLIREQKAVVDIEI